MSSSMYLEDRCVIWIYRLALARLAGNGDSYDDTVAEIQAAGGACPELVEAAISEFCAVIEDLHTTPLPPGSECDGVVDTEAATEWMQKLLDDELYRIEIEQ